MRRMLALVAVAIIALAMVLVQRTPAAQAADISDELTNVSATLTGSESPQNGYNARYEMTFGATVPDSAVAGDTWTVQLPKQFTGYPSGPISGQVDGADVITITIDDATDIATFTLTEAGAGINNLSFVSSFNATLETQQTLEPIDLVNFYVAHICLPLTDLQR